MIAARAGTGKTTILKLLDRQRRTSDSGSFLSDDLTLVTPSGGVLTYPRAHDDQPPYRGGNQYPAALAASSG